MSGERKKTPPSNNDEATGFSRGEATVLTIVKTGLHNGWFAADTIGCTAGTSKKLNGYVSDQLQADTLESVR